MKECHRKFCSRPARIKWCSDACRQAAYRERHADDPAPVYVYRLVVEYPEGVGPDNPPKKWEPMVVDTIDGPERQVFSWPTRIHYMSRAGANERADLLRRWGCTVTIKRSNPVTWDEP